MSEEDYTIRRPKHCYGNQLKLIIEERALVTIGKNREDGSPVNSPIEGNPPNSLVSLQLRIGTCLFRNRGSATRGSRDSRIFYCFTWHKGTC